MESASASDLVMSADVVDRSSGSAQAEGGVHHEILHQNQNDGELPVSSLGLADGLQQSSCYLYRRCRTSGRCWLLECTGNDDAEVVLFLEREEETTLDHQRIWHGNQTTRLLGLLPDRSTRGNALAESTVGPDLILELPTSQ